MNKLNTLSENDALSLLDYSILNGYPVIYFDRLDKNSYKQNKKVIGNVEDWYKPTEDEELTEDERKKIEEIIEKLGSR